VHSPTQFRLRRARWEPSCSRGASAPRRGTLSASSRCCTSRYGCCASAQVACAASSPVQQRSFLRLLLPRESAVTVGTRHHDFPHNRAGLSTSSVGESAQSAWRQTLAADRAQQGASVLAPAAVSFTGRSRTSELRVYERKAHARKREAVTHRGHQRERTGERKRFRVSRSPRSAIPACRDLAGRRQL